MSEIHDGWFYSHHPTHCDQSIGIKIKEILYNKKSEYQDILLFESEKCGKVLVLDGAIQFTEFDEFVYQEMISFLPLCSHEDPKDVLVIGGGDGGVLREVVKFPSINNITICEIDEQVIKACQSFAPSMSCGFNNEKVNVVIDDAFKFIQNNKNSFDIIICDISDIDGPAEQLYSDEFLNLINQSLKHNGVASFQAESLWYHHLLIRNLIKNATKVFKTVRYASSNVPTYPSGQIGYMIMAKQETDLTIPKHKISKETNLKYYNEHVHTASFVIPFIFSQRIYNP